MQKIITAIIKNGGQKEVNQDNVELVRHRIGLLSGQEKIVMSLYYIDGCSFRRIAALFSINECNVARRIRRISNKLVSNRYIECIQNRQYFNQEQLQIAQEYYIVGRTIKQIAEKRKNSFYKVRRAIITIESILDAIEQNKTGRTGLTRPTGLTSLTATNRSIEKRNKKEEDSYGIEGE